VSPWFEGDTIYESMEGGLIETLLAFAFIHLCIGRMCYLRNFYVPLIYHVKIKFDFDEGTFLSM